MDETQELLDLEAKINNLRSRSLDTKLDNLHLRVIELIKQKRGNVSPICWGKDDCSIKCLIRCPWRIDCGEQKE